MKKITHLSLIFICLFSFLSGVLLISNSAGRGFFENDYEDIEIDAFSGDTYLYASSTTTGASLGVSATLSSTTVTSGSEVSLTLSALLEQDEVPNTSESGHVFVINYGVNITIIFGGKTYSASLNPNTSGDLTNMPSDTSTVKLATTGLTGKQTINIKIEASFSTFITPLGSDIDYDSGSITNKFVTVNPATATIKRGTLTNVSSIYYGTSSSSQTTLLSSTSGISLTAGTYYFRYVLSSATGYTYTFSSWSGSLSGTGNPKSLTITAGNTYTIGASATRLANTYNLSYVLNNGTHGTYHPTSGTYDTALQISNPTRTGYTFTGWTARSLTFT